MDYCKQVVDRLILQYKEYLYLNKKIKELENKKFAEILKSKSGKKVKLIEDTIALVKTDLNQVSNEMTFANPIIWMMYKYRAYKNTSNEISTLEDFRKHCEPEGYICTARYKFLKEFMRKNLSIDLDNKSLYPDTLELDDFYTKKEITSLLENHQFLKMWKEKEYLITKNKINKWNTGV